MGETQLGNNNDTVLYTVYNTYTHVVPIHLHKCMCTFTYIIIAGTKDIIASTQ